MIQSIDKIKQLSEKAFENKIFRNIAIGIGTIQLLRIGYGITQSTWRLIRPAKNLLKRYGEGSWALVTGATDGIGKAFCEELAARGFNIIVVGRDETKSSNVAQHLKSINPNIQTKVVIADFQQGFNLSLYDHILEEVQNLDISVLVNNVGIGKFQKIQESNEQDIVDQVVINCIPQSVLTNRLIKQLKTRQQKSAIISISSLLTSFNMPTSSCLTATKGFNEEFSDLLLKEADGKIDVLSVQVGLVVTDAFKKAKGPDTIINITPNQCARGTLQALGYENKTPGHYKHRIMSFFVGFAK